MLLAKAERSLAALENAASLGASAIAPEGTQPKYFPLTGLDVVAPSMPSYDGYLHNKMAALEKRYLSKASAAISASFPPEQSANHPASMRPRLAVRSLASSQPRRQLEAQRAMAALTAAVESRRAAMNKLRARFDESLKRAHDRHHGAVKAQYIGLRDQLMALLKTEVVERLSLSMDVRSARPFTAAVMKTATTAIAQLEVKLQEVELSASAETQSMLLSLESELDGLIEAAAEEVKEAARGDKEKALALQEDRLRVARDDAMSAMTAQLRRDLERDLMRKEEESRNETEFLIEKEKRALIPRLSRQNELELQRLQGRLTEEREAKMKAAEEDLRAELQRKHEEQVHALEMTHDRELKVLKDKVSQEAAAQSTLEMRRLEVRLADSRDKTVANFRVQQQKGLDDELERKRAEGAAAEQAAIDLEMEVWEQERTRRLKEADEEIKRTQRETIAELRRQVEERIATEVDEYRAALQASSQQQVQRAQAQAEEEGAAELGSLLRSIDKEVALSSKRDLLAAAAQHVRRGADPAAAVTATSGFGAADCSRLEASASHRQSAGGRSSSHSRPSSAAASSMRGSFSSMAARAIARARDEGEEDETEDEASAVNISRIYSLNPRSLDASFLSSTSGGRGAAR